MEREFLAVVRAFREIGFGRMMQIIAYEWASYQPDRAAMEECIGYDAEGHPIRPSGAQLLEMRASDPLAAMWASEL